VDIGLVTFQSELVPIFTALLADLLAGATFSFDMVDPTNPAFNPAVAAAFLKVVNLAKWVIDPGDPVNYAAHVKLLPLPNLLANKNGSVAQPAKAVYAQIATGDATVPNSASEELYALIMGGLPGVTTTYSGAGASHDQLFTQARVQADAVGFLVDPTSPPPTTRTIP